MKQEMRRPGRGMYLRLAWTGIRKNRQLYAPYFVAGMAMVMVFYIFRFLGASAVVAQLPGKEVLPVLFDVGGWGIGVFSIPFLFYTSAGLIKSRKKELGLYNILGMNKGNLFHVLFWETVISYVVTLLGGLLLGVAFSKVAELGLCNIMDKQVNYRIYVDGASALTAAALFAVIYLLILLNSLWQIRRSNPIELLHGGSVGERPPKSRKIPAILGLLLLAAAYGVAVKMRNPIGAGEVAAVGVFLIAGTFLLFLCVSVFLCRTLQNNKKYYYKTSHFVTISTMSFRMKRNGASLAAICILVTLILAILSFAVAFYSGSIGTVNRHYPYDAGVSVEIPAENVSEEMTSGTYTRKLRAGLENVMKSYEDTANTEISEDYSANLMAVMEDGCLDLRLDMRDTWYTPGYFTGWERGSRQIVYVHVLSLADYNRLCGTSYTLSPDEVLLASEDVRYASDHLILCDGNKIKVKEQTRKIPVMTGVRLDGIALDVYNCDEIYLAVSDLYSFMGGNEDAARYDEANYMAYHWEFGVNVDGTDQEKQDIYEKMEKAVAKLPGESEDSARENPSADAGNADSTDNGGSAGNADSAQGNTSEKNTAYNADGTSDTVCYLKAERGERFYGLAGGLLFLAIIMNVLFVFVTALIMYYKQISEGYEDQNRFAIMRKIGMTAGEIKKSIRSQMLTVFSLPLLVAGVHFVFTSNIIYIMLNYSVMDDRPLLNRVMLLCYLIFAVIYSAVYALTSRTYYRIVNRAPAS